MTDVQSKNEQTINERTIADYFGDLIALENHIEQALDHQLKLTKDDRIAGPAVRNFHDLVRGHLKTLQDLQPEVGTTAGNPIIAVGTSIVGKAAGLVDLVRTEAISKALRDDYTAFGLATISYAMFHATATALGDHALADVAKKHLTGYAGATQRISDIIADVVVSELAKDDHQVDGSAAAATTAMIHEVWAGDSASV